MKKIFLIIISLILCACHTTPQLEGTWKCEKSPLENKDIYTAYLTLEIDKDLSQIVDKLDENINWAIPNWYFHFRIIELEVIQVIILVFYFI